MKTIAKLLGACALLAACGGDTQAEAAQDMAEQMGAPTEAQVQQGLAAGDIDTGGRVEASLGGGLTGSTNMTDVTFCITEVAGARVFAMVANNPTRSISMGSIKGLPAPGSYTISAADPEGITMGFIDKSTGSAPSDWQQYNAVSGTVEISAAGDQRVTGSYDFTATPSYPRNTGANVTIQGTFDAPPASSC